MSEPIKKERSPSSPRIPLSDALEITKRLYTKAGRAAIKPENAVQAMGYGGLNGAALATLAALKQYGLLESQRGESVSVSALAVKLIHPLNPSQEAESLRIAALNPKIFNDLYSQGYGDCSEDVLANHLVQSNFTPEGARKAASVYKENEVFAKLKEPSINLGVTSEPPSSVREESRPLTISIPTSKVRVSDAIDESPQEPLIPKGQKMLAQYSIPLGANQATLVFTGIELTAEDFDALHDYVDLFKKQFMRAQTFAQKFAATPAAECVMLVKDGSKVSVVEVGVRDGQKVYRDQHGVEYLQSEIL
jgi:hypothetical protein